MKKKEKLGCGSVKSTKELLKITLLSLCMYAATDYAHPPELNKLKETLTGKNLIYLTHWGLYLTILTIFMGYTANSFSNRKLLLIYKNLLSITIPIEIFITSTYWGMYFIDPVLLRNKDLHAAGVKTSMLTDISLHLIPLVLLVLDQTKIKTEEQNHHYLLLCAIGACFFAFSHYCSIMNGSWPCSFLNEISKEYRTILIIVSMLIILIYYKLYFKIYSFASKIK